MSLFSFFSKKTTEEPAVADNGGDIVAAAISMALAEHLSEDAGPHDSERHCLTIRHSGAFGRRPGVPKPSACARHPICEPGAAAAAAEPSSFNPLYSYHQKTNSFHQQ